MKNKQSHTVAGTLEIVERQKNSMNGNPRYLVRIGETYARTKPDSSLGYSITNHRGNHVTAEIVSYRGRAHVESMDPANA